jgi:RHS repeat-associated protein
MIFDKTGSLANTKRHDYLPFGEELFANQGLRNGTIGYSNSDSVREKFTQKERDAETGLDYFDARYYGSMMGRFTSADTLVGSLTNPQTLNRYAYVGNDPLNFTDPTGHARFDVPSKFENGGELGSNPYEDAIAWQNVEYTIAAADAAAANASSKAGEAMDGTAGKAGSDESAANGTADPQNDTVTFETVSLLSNDRHDSKDTSVRTANFDPNGTATLNVDTTTGPDVWGGEPFTIRVKFVLPYGSTGCCENNSTYENDVRLSANSIFKFASKQISPGRVREGYQFSVTETRGYVDITLKMPSLAEGKSNKVEVIVGGTRKTWRRDNTYHNTANIRLVFDERRRFRPGGG